MPEKFHLISSVTCPWVQRSVITMRLTGEQFDNAVFLYKSKAQCQGRKGKEAVRIADDLMVEYRGLRDKEPELSKVVLKNALDKFLRVGATAAELQCKEFAADQYRRVRRIVRRLDLPGYREQAAGGLKALGME